jgi:hypothetical protein
MSAELASENGQHLFGKNDATVAGPWEAPYHVGSHAAQSDHAQFHVAFLSPWRLKLALIVRGILAAGQLSTGF